MAQITQLSPSALPGPRYQFSPKGISGSHSGKFTELSVLSVPGAIHQFSAKGISGPHSGKFTELSTIASPGMIHAFLAKEVSGPHSGKFTELSLMAVPGMQHVFAAKGEIEEAAAEIIRKISSGVQYDFEAEDKFYRKRFAQFESLKEDGEIKELLEILAKLGVFD